MRSCWRATRHAIPSLHTSQKTLKLSLAMISRETSGHGQQQQQQAVPSSGTTAPAHPRAALFNGSPTQTLVWHGQRMRQRATETPAAPELPPPPPTAARGADASPPVLLARCLRRASQAAAASHPPPKNGGQPDGPPDAVADPTSKTRSAKGGRARKAGGPSSVLLVASIGRVQQHLMANSGAASFGVATQLSSLALDQLRKGEIEWDRETQQLRPKSAAAKAAAVGAEVATAAAAAEAAAAGDQRQDGAAVPGGLRPLLLMPKSAPPVAANGAAAAGAADASAGASAPERQAWVAAGTKLAADGSSRLGSGQGLRWALGLSNQAPENPTDTLMQLMPGGRSRRSAGQARASAAATGAGAASAAGAAAAPGAAASASAAAGNGAPAAQRLGRGLGTLTGAGGMAIRGTRRLDSAKPGRTRLAGRQPQRLQRVGDAPAAGVLQSVASEAEAAAESLLAVAAQAERAALQQRRLEERRREAAADGTKGAAAAAAGDEVGNGGAAAAGQQANGGLARGDVEVVGGGQRGQGNQRGRGGGRGRTLEDVRGVRLSREVRSLLTPVAVRRKRQAAQLESDESGGQEQEEEEGHKPTERQSGRRSESRDDLKQGVTAAVVPKAERSTPPADAAAAAADGGVKDEHGAGAGGGHAAAGAWGLLRGLPKRAAAPSNLREPSLKKWRFGGEPSWVQELHSPVRMKQEGGGGAAGGAGRRGHCKQRRTGGKARLYYDNKAKVLKWWRPNEEGGAAVEAGGEGAEARGGERERPPKPEGMGPVVWVEPPGVWVPASMPQDYPWEEFGGLYRRPPALRPLQQFYDPVKINLSPAEAQQLHMGRRKRPRR